MLYILVFLALNTNFKKSVSKYCFSFRQSPPCLIIIKFDIFRTKGNQIHFNPKFPRSASHRMIAAENFNQNSELHNCYSLESTGGPTVGLMPIEGAFIKALVRIY